MRMFAWVRSLHDVRGVSAEGGEQRGDDGDYQLTNALEGFLCTVFHEDSPPSPLFQRGE